MLGKLRTWVAIALAGGIVFVDSVSRLWSMVGDALLVALLLVVLLAWK